MEADVDDRASPAVRADEDVHNPSADGFDTYQERGLRNKPDRRCNGGIGADVFRRRKQKVLGFVVSRIEID